MLEATLTSSPHYYVGITQRDTNFYEHLTDKETQILILNTITHLWEKEIKYKWLTMDCEQLSLSNSV